MATPAYLLRLVDPWLDELLAQLSGLIVIGPRAAGKTTTMSRRAKTVIRLDQEAQAAAFLADPDAALKDLEEPVLLDEWQEVPGVFGAARRALENDPKPNRFFLTGSVLKARDKKVYPGTGRFQQLRMYPMTIREQLGDVGSASFFDKLVAGRELSLPGDVPDLRGYVELAVRGGFPRTALQLSGAARNLWLESYIDDLLSHDVEQIEEPTTRKRDSERLRRYFDAWAVNTAGTVSNHRLLEAAEISKDTGSAYRQLLADLLIVEELPGWRSNRFKRLVEQRKRYMIDPALAAAALRVDASGILADGDLLGRMIDTFVAAQLRPEAQVSNSRPKLYHLRTEGGRQEVDLLVELAGRRLIGIEIKAGAAPTRGDARHLIWLRDGTPKDKFLSGIVFHTGPQIYELDDKIMAAPIAAIWG